MILLEFNTHPYVKKSTGEHAQLDLQRANQKVDTAGIHFRIS